MFFLDNSKEILSSFIFEKKALQNNVEKFQEDLKNLQSETDKLKEECAFWKSNSSYIKEQNQIIEMKLKAKDYEIQEKIDESKLLQQELAEITNKLNSNLSFNADLNSKNIEMATEIKKFENKLKLMTEEWEEKQSEQMKSFSQNLLNIKKVLKCTKEVIINLKGEKEKLQKDYRLLNEDYQTLHCKYLNSAKAQKEMDHKLDIMNVSILFFIFVSLYYCIIVLFIIFIIIYYFLM